MKRKILLIGVMILFGAFAFAGALAPERESLNFKFGLSKGNAEIDVEDGTEIGDPEVTVDLSKSVNIEYIASTAKGFEYGVGAGFTEINTGAFTHDELETIGEEVGEIYSVPVYVLARFKFENEKDWEPYVFGNLGFAYVNEEVVDTSGTPGEEETVMDIGGEFYFAFGVGAEYQEKLSVELMFSQTNMDVEWSGPDAEDDGDMDVQLLTLSVGYRLDI